MENNGKDLEMKEMEDISSTSSAGASKARHMREDEVEPEEVNKPKKSSSETYTDTYVNRTNAGHHHHHSSSHSSSRKSRKKRHRKKVIKRVIIASVSVLLALVLIAVGTYFYMYFSGRSQITDNGGSAISHPEDVETIEGENIVIYNGERYKFNDKIANILFMGIDKKAVVEDETVKVGENGQADTIILASIDVEKKKVTFFNVPRDIMTDIKIYSPTGGFVGTKKMQLCLSYAYGENNEASCYNTTDAVRRIFYNIPINSYYSLNINGISPVNDSVGGVDVVSPETILDFVKGESYHLEGKDAYNFVHERNMETLNANLLRNSRQKVYIKSFIKKVTDESKSDITYPMTVFKSASPYAYTNITTNQVTYLATEFINNDFKMEFESIPVDVSMGVKYAENTIKETEFFEKFLNVYYNKIS